MILKTYLFLYDNIPDLVEELSGGHDEAQEQSSDQYYKKPNQMCHLHVTFILILYFCFLR